jgi:hypothetical protein
MSLANPTPLQVGLSGVLGGRRYTVAGRVVMSMDEGFSTYYWNEFNLVNDAGETATLVYEETENGPEWRLFTLIEPPPAITADEARRRRVGDQVSLDGQTLRVTLVDQSRVRHIEGTAPEGVEVGDHADYFNLGSGHRMWVVSWSGDEVECYRGVTIPASVVARAFELTLPSSKSSRLFTAGHSNGETAMPKWAGNLVVLLVIVGFFVVIGMNCRSSKPVHRSSDVPKTLPAPVSKLAVGDTGRLGNRFYRVVGHSVREVRRVGLVHQWHEYHLIADDNAGEILVLGLLPPQRTWHLFQGARTDVPLTPHFAAAKRLGDRVRVNGADLTVVDLFLSQPHATEGEPLPGLSRTSTRYHFRAEAPGDVVLASWDNGGVELMRGWKLTEEQVVTAFGSKASGTR